MASYLILSSWREKFARGAYSLCFYTLLQPLLQALASVINVNKRIKGIQIGDHELKNKNKILEVNFGNSILDNSKWDKISEGIAKNPYLELRGKKIIVNQKIRPPRYLAQISIWMIGLGILDIETQLNSLKIKLD